MALSYLNLNKTYIKIDKYIFLWYNYSEEMEKMKEKRKRRQEQIEKIFKIYNGSAVEYHTPHTSSKSITSLCSSGSSVARGTSVADLINAARK